MEIFARPASLVIKNGLTQISAHKVIVNHILLNFIELASSLHISTYSLHQGIKASDISFTEIPRLVSDTANQRGN